MHTYTWGGVSSALVIVGMDLEHSVGTCSGLMDLEGKGEMGQSKGEISWRIYCCLTVPFMDG